MWTIGLDDYEAMNLRAMMEAFEEVANTGDWFRQILSRLPMTAACKPNLTAVELREEAAARFSAAIQERAKGMEGAALGAANALEFAGKGPEAARVRDEVLRVRALPAPPSAPTREGWARELQRADQLGYLRAIEEAKQKAYHYAEIYHDLDNGDAEKACAVVAKNIARIGASLLFGKQAAFGKVGEDPVSGESVAAGGVHGGAPVEVEESPPQPEPSAKSPIDERELCPRCRGTGEIVSKWDGNLVKDYRKCSTCDGRGLR